MEKLKEVEEQQMSFKRTSQHPASMLYFEPNILSGSDLFDQRGGGVEHLTFSNY